MASAIVTCPTCFEKGRIPESFIGSRIKCAKCGNRFLVAASVPAAAHRAASTPAAAHPAPHLDGIPVDGITDDSWHCLNVAAFEIHHEHHEPEPQPSTPEPAAEPTPVAPADRPAGKQYKVLTQKDKWFDGKFDLTRLEEAINAFAQQGWTVKAMTTAHIAAFSGGPKEELIVLLER